MKCGNCGTDLASSACSAHEAGSDSVHRFRVENWSCSGCNQSTLLIGANRLDDEPGGLVNLQVWPLSRSGLRPPAPEYVPWDLAEDYNVASAFLHISPRASVALSRRCLQEIIRDHVDLKHLYLEFDRLITTGALPRHVVANIDAIRAVGKFVDHLLRSIGDIKIAPGAFAPAEEEEAKWNLEVLLGVFEHCFAEPARERARREAVED